jgi:hypothetical protein
MPMTNHVVGRTVVRKAGEGCLDHLRERFCKPHSELDRLDFRLLPEAPDGFLIVVGRDQHRYFLDLLIEATRAFLAGWAGAAKG